jgi:hypothetical protein
MVIAPVRRLSLMVSAIEGFPLEVSDIETLHAHCRLALPTERRQFWSKVMQRSLGIAGFVVRSDDVPKRCVEQVTGLPFVFELAVA